MDVKDIWLYFIGVKLEKLLRLPIGWDGYKGLPVRQDNAMFAANILDQVYVDNLPMPSVVPGSDGTLQLEWHKNGISVEVEVINPLLSSTIIYDRNSGTDEEFENNILRIKQWLICLSK